MPSVLFVCTANQCRSPTAQALFEHKLEQEGLEQEWRVASAGTLALPGIQATPHAREVVKEVGLDMEPHRSQPVDEQLLSQFDLILVMEQGHKEALQFEFSTIADRVYMLSELAGPAYSIPDPIGRSIDDYREMRDELGRLIERGFERMREIVDKREP
jgi:protein-tyrosine-phosphatase